MSTDKGVKLDSGKVRADLIISGMPNALMLVAEVATYGANKYTENGWKTVQDAYNRYTAAMDRHRLRENIDLIDDESGLLHQAHVAWNALARLEIMIKEANKQNQ